MKKIYLITKDLETDLFQKAKDLLTKLISSLALAIIFKIKMIKIFLIDLIRKNKAKVE